MVKRCLVSSLAMHSWNSGLCWDRESDCIPREGLSILFLFPGGSPDTCACLLQRREAKFWLEPQIELAENFRLTRSPNQRDRATYRGTLR
jgi:hypothetical protein